VNEVIEFASHVALLSVVVFALLWIISAIFPPKPPESIKLGSPEVTGHVVGQEPGGTVSVEVTWTVVPHAVAYEVEYVLEGETEHRYYATVLDTRCVMRLPWQKKYNVSVRALANALPPERTA
jgi:hypothetical protein